jgi:hypothetical protein
MSAHKLIVLATLLTFAAAAAGDDASPVAFKTQQLSDKFYSEGAHFADLDRDGKIDVIAGPFWYAGPDFRKRYEIYAPQEIDPKGYSRNFLCYTHDINGDGWTDVVVIGFPGAETWWFENPGSGVTSAGHWKQHVILPVVDNESPTFTDITGDGRPELVCSVGGHWGYATPDPADPTRVWTFHAISPKTGAQRFTHGLGVGDVNGDGRMDLLEKSGWWEQPASLEGDPVWKRHEFEFTKPGGAQMFAYDVDGDGLNDVITSLAGHGYGLAWFRQVRHDGQISFDRQLIIGEKPEESAYGVAFSQLHALDLVDIDGDGLKDIITGKRWWAHGPMGDPEPNAPAVIYWFQLVRKDGKAHFIPRLIHDDSGVGTQVIAGDLNGDGRPDVIVGNKKGTFVHIQARK